MRQPGDKASASGRALRHAWGHVSRAPPTAAPEGAMQRRDGGKCDRSWARSSRERRKTQIEHNRHAASNCDIHRPVKASLQVKLEGMHYAGAQTKRVLDVPDFRRRCPSQAGEEMPQSHARNGRSIRQASANSLEPRRQVRGDSAGGENHPAAALRALYVQMQGAAGVGHAERLLSARADKTRSSTDEIFASLAACAVTVNHSALIELRRLACFAAPGVMPTARAKAAGPPKSSITSANELGM